MANKSAYEMDTVAGKLSPRAFVPGSASTVMLMWMSSEKWLVKTSAAAYPGSLCRCCVRAEIRVEVGRKRGSNDQNDLPLKFSRFGPLPQVWVLGLVVVERPR